MSFTGMSPEEHRKRQERTDKISGLMGKYMLLGYRMLGSCCDKCGTVLLKYQDKDTYCVACSEVDVQEQEEQESAFAKQQEEQKTPIRTGSSITFNTPTENQQSSHGMVTCNDEVINTAVSAISDKVVWASEALRACHSTEESIQLCNLIKVCGETLNVLQSLKAR